MSPSFLYKIRGLSASEWIILAEIPFAFLGAVFAAKIMPLKSLQRHLEKRLPASKSPVPLRAMESIQRLTRAVFRRLPFEPGCVEKALTLLILLRRQGLNPDFKIGFKKDGPRLKAHAWLEQDQKILFDDPSVCGEYAAISLPSPP